MQTSTTHIISYTVISTLLIFILAGLIIMILFLYQKRLFYFKEKYQELVAEHEKILLQAQIEIQEQTFNQISGEIHDNINLALTLAKLRLNTLEWNDIEALKSSVTESKYILGEAINSLQNLSRSMNSEIILNLGLHKAVQMELERLEKIAKIKIEYNIEGESLFMNGDKELILFRIIQEALNNIIKHSKAEKVNLSFCYKTQNLNVNISDNGVGFTNESNKFGDKIYSGLLNMKNRAKTIGGDISVISSPGLGTSISVLIPYTSAHE